jgi:hypothetical protein
LNFVPIKRPPSQTLKFSVPSVHKNDFIDVAFRLPRRRCHSDVISTIKGTSRPKKYSPLFKGFVCPMAQSSTLISSPSFIYCSYLFSVPSFILILIQSPRQSGSCYYTPPTLLLVLFLRCTVPILPVYRYVSMPARPLDRLHKHAPTPQAIPTPECTKRNGGIH